MSATSSASDPPPPRTTASTPPPVVVQPTMPALLPATRSTLPSIPSLLYGTAWKSTHTTALVLSALASGFRAIDTAAQLKHYREDLVGAALQQAQHAGLLRREDVWLQTKFTPPDGQDWSAPVPYARHEPVETMVAKSLENSLRVLHPWWTGEIQVQAGAAKGKQRQHEQRSEDQGDEPAETTAARQVERDHPYIDSYLLHSPLPTLGETLQAWKVMEAFVDAGLVRQIGLSNVYDPTIFHALFTSARIKPSILQNRWHFSTGHDVSLLSKLSPVLSPNDFPPPSLDDSAASQVETPRGIVYQPFWSLTGNPRLLTSPAVQDAAVRRKWTPQQVVYGYIARGMGVPGLQTAVLSGTTKEDHMREAVEAADRDGAAWQDTELDAIRKEVYGE